MPLSLRLFSNLLCLRSPLPRFQGRVSSSFWFLPLVGEGGPVVSVGVLLGGLVPALWWEEASFPLTGTAVGWCVAGHLQEACLLSLRVCPAWCWGEVSRCCQQLRNAGPWIQQETFTGVLTN